MAKEIGILTIHGIGKQREDFDQDLRENLYERLDNEVGSALKFRRIFWQQDVQGNQYDTWERMKREEMDGHALRKVFLFSFGDVGVYQFRASETASAYQKIHNRIRQEIDGLREDLGNVDGPVVIFGHSLGCQMISDYIWDSQRRKGIWKDKVPSGFQKLETMTHFFTAGCNIPIMVSGLTKIEAFNLPNPTFKWINYYDRDDILGWPLKPLSDGFANSYNDIVTEDIEINTGWTFKSHTGYWKDRDFIRPVVDLITGLHASL